MAKELDNGGFWLPSEFLTDEDLLTDFRAQRRGGFSHMFGSYVGFNSDLCSPVESLTGSVETESDEDDFISGLTQRMGKTSLQSSNFSSDYRAKGWKMYGSPQSTLCGCESGTSWACPNCVTRAPSPTEAKTALNWDMLYAAFEEVSRLRREEEKASFLSSKLLPQQHKPTTYDSLPFGSRCPTTGFYPYKSRAEAQLAFLQLRATQFQRMKQEQQQQIMRRVGVWGQGTSPDFHFQPDRRNRTMAGGLTESWPTLQQSTQQRRPHQQPHQPNVYLGENGLNKERNGTGVFLPRRFGFNSTETRNKPAALNPDKVGHCLSMNAEYDGTPQNRHRNPPPGAVKMEVRLPQEWSY